jgi:hypothetical protein
MGRAPFSRRSVELQAAMTGLRMILYEEPGNPDHSVAITTNAEVNGIGMTFRREMRAVIGISKIAALTQSVVGGRTRGVGSRAAAHKAIAERQAATEWPQLGIVPGDRKEIGTGHEVLGTGILRAILLASESLALGKSC